MVKGSDYIVEFLVSHGVTDIFGYPGATVCHLMDSLEKNSEIDNHLNYHEQACAFAACGYAQSSGKLGVAYANGGPGFTNLVTGIVDAFYDSLPTFFICGQVDTTDMVGEKRIRQRGIQEIPISKIASSFTKKSIYVDRIENLQSCLDEAYILATTGRPGPVVLEIPANIQRATFDPQSRTMETSTLCGEKKDEIAIIDNYLSKAKKPLILAGNGIKVSGLKKLFNEVVHNLGIPVVFSMPAFDLLEYENPLNYGFIGNNGFRYSNYILYESDLIISIGTRLDGKQVGKKTAEFIHGASLLRIDIDANELSEKISDNEIQVNLDARVVLNYLKDSKEKYIKTSWIEMCDKLKKCLIDYDLKKYHLILRELLNKASNEAIFTADVGHHEVYMAQALQLKEKQTAIMSLGLASMGYSLPAAIGAHYVNRSQVISLSGDGGIQMNIQELQMLTRDNLPIKVIVFNNNTLGMVREFQERNFNGICCQTTEEYGYTVPDFEAIAKAYKIKYTRLFDNDIASIQKFKYQNSGPELIELVISEPTYLYPRFARGKRICDMEPALDNETKRIVENITYAHVAR